ncbi:MAG: poly-gamma-glutamate synthase PgsB [Ignavibacteriales bacterium]|nr:poly-gamma-glutamate synthase PgsB [Ignavibacteriales bacterium]
MNRYIIISLSFLLIALVYFVIEYFSLKRARNSIVHRVMVNGTRGKSSVTAYLAAGIRANNIKTFAKITGIVPTIINELGKEEIIIRRGAARVHEQFTMIRLAAKKAVTAIVLECMSLQPEYQKIESQALQPSLYIITNIGDDHFEEMGKTRSERITAICGAIPTGGKVLTVQDENISEVKAIVQKKHATLHLCKLYVDAATLPDGIFPHNINLALTAIELMGLNTEKALAEILTNAQPFSKYLYRINTEKYKCNFVNGFAVNDTPSAETFVKYWLKILSPVHCLTIVLNTRADRPERTILFCNWLAAFHDIKKVIVTGTHSQAAIRLLKKSSPRLAVKIPLAKDIMLSLPDCIFEGKGNHLMIGLGNIAGKGFEIIALMESIEKESEL